MSKIIEKKGNYQIRQPSMNDLSALVELEKATWRDLAATPEMIESRLQISVKRLSFILRTNKIKL